MYDVDVFKENIVIGNDALMKCQIPSLVSDLSSVDSWVDSNGNEILATEGYGNFNGPHFDHGGYVFYIHPHWDESWEGKIKFTHAVEEEYRNGIHAKPNRFIWIDQETYHDVTTTASNTTHARVANIAFLGGDWTSDPIGTINLNKVVFKFLFKRTLFSYNPSTPTPHGDIC